MTRIKFVLLLSIVLVTFGTHELLATTTGTTYAVGSCKPGLQTYTTIQDALNALPAPTVVLVCPGTYNQQVTITQAVTLEGISNGNADQVVIAPPLGGLAVNATDDFGDQLAVQLWVNNAAGTVNISNITVDGTGNNISGSGCSLAVVGIFYQNSPGTVNRVTARNQSGNGCGLGIWLEGGPANPSLTVENSSIHDFDWVGILTETHSGSSELNATIKGNEVNGNNSNANVGILIEQGTTDSVTGNFVIGPFWCLESFSGANGSMSANTVSNCSYGVFAGADGVSVTSNKFFNNRFGGILVSTSAAAIQGNSITESAVGIDFGCNVSNNVHSNAINDATTGVHAPAGVVTTNTYYNVGTIRTGC